MAASNLFSQVTPAMFNLDKDKEINKVISYLHATIEAKLRCEQLDMVKARIVVLADGSHATNAYSSSQLGFMIFLTCDVNWHLLHFKRYKSLVRSPLAAETNALTDAADMAILVQHYLYHIYGQMLCITLLTDAKSIFDFLLKWTMATEK